MYLKTKSPIVETHRSLTPATRKRNSICDKLIKQDQIKMMLQTWQKIILQQLKSYALILKKKLPTPVLTCSKVYTLQQLWTYNLAVHDLSNDQVTMFMWHEGQASKS